MSRPRRDASHRTFSSSNYASRSAAHEAEGRLRIDFNNPTFSSWRELWGQNVYFKSFEYRKHRSLLQHEYILLQGLFAIPGDNVATSTPAVENQATPSGSGAPRRKSTGLMQSSTAIKAALGSSTLSGDPDPVWYSRIPEDINDKPYILKLEREASPETQANAVHRTEAYDFIDFKTFEELGIADRNSTVELAMTFPRVIALEEVIMICRSISQHPVAQQYTLRQFNCYFFAWSLTAMLVRLNENVNWTRVLRLEARRTSGTLSTRMVELSNPQRIRGQEVGSNANIEVRPNLALFLAEEYTSGEILDGTQRPFIRRFLSSLAGRRPPKTSTFESIASALMSHPERPLWPHDQLEVIRDKVRELLNVVADSTMDLATAGTGESRVADLFWADTEIILDPEWNDRVNHEHSRLLAVYIKRMWPAFREALIQTNEAERPSTPDQTDLRRTGLANIESWFRQMGNSPPILGTRLSGLGMRAAWNAADVAASVHLPDPQTEEQSFARTMRRLRHTPGQMARVMGIGVPFLELLATRRERARTNGGEQGASGEDTMSLNTFDVLGMMGDLKFDPEGEDEIIVELERSVKNMALACQSSDFSVDELRKATLALLIRLKKTGMKLNFGLDPDQIWRVCVWYSLSEEILRTLVLAPETPYASEPDRRIRCWLRSPGGVPRSMGGEKKPTQSSKIYEFIQGRIAKLSEILRDQEAAKACRMEIEEAMTKIWQDIPLEGGVS